MPFLLFILFPINAILTYVYVLIYAPYIHIQSIMRAQVNIYRDTLHLNTKRLTNIPQCKQLETFIYRYNTCVLKLRIFLVKMFHCGLQLNARQTVTDGFQVTTSFDVQLHTPTSNRLAHCRNITLTKRRRVNARCPFPNTTSIASYL